MKIVLLILNGNLSAEHLINKAISLSGSSHCFFHAVFINHSPDLNEYDYIFPNDLALTRNRTSQKIIKEEDAAVLKDNMGLFEVQFNAAKLDYRIDADEDMTLGKLLHLSSFADFILIDGTHSASHYHLADLLANAHCPIYLVSSSYQQPEQIVLAYDGEDTSIVAIKTFAQLFIELKDLPATLAYSTNDNSPELPERKYVEEWLSRHYNKVKIEILTGNASEALPDFIRSIPNSLVVMGSFGRSALSRFFHKSLASVVLEESPCALFIAH